MIRMQVGLHKLSLAIFVSSLVFPVSYVLSERI